MQLSSERTLIDFEGIPKPRVLPSEAPTYPYVPPLVIQQFYQGEVPLQTTENFIQVPQPNNIIEMNTRVEVSGIIYNNKGGSVIGVTLQVFDSSGQKLTEPILLDSSSYYVWTDLPATSVFVTFSKKGYADNKTSFAQLQINPDIIMIEGDKFPTWIIIAVLAAVFLYRKKTKKVGALGTSDLMPIFILAGGIIGFSVIKSILEKFGIWDSKDTKDLDNESGNPNSFWSPNYWQTIKPAGKNWTYAIDERTAGEWLLELYTSFGAFNDCESCAIAIFKRCKTKANVSFLAWIFQKHWGQDLLTWLRGGNWPDDRLSDEDTAEINKYIKGLPSY